MKPSEKAELVGDTVDSMGEDQLRSYARKALWLELSELEREAIAAQKVEEKITREPQYHFTKVYKVQVRRLIREKLLSKAEKAFLFDVIPFVNRDTNIIVDERGFPMGQKKLMELCDIGRTTLSKVTTSLIQLELLFPEEVEGKTYYRMNQQYFECKRKALNV